MAIAIGVQITGIKDVVARLQKLDQEAKKLTRNAINDTARHVRTEAVKSVRAEWNLKAGVVRDQFDIRRATLGTPEAVVTASGKPMALIQFNARATPQGVAYRAKRSGKGFVRSAFIAVMRSGHRGVFIRRSKPRLPILERVMPAVHMMWAPYVDEQMPKASAFLKRRILQLLQRERDRR